MNRTFYYTYVSSREQNIDRQLEVFAKPITNKPENWG